MAVPSAFWASRRHLLPRAKSALREIALVGVISAIVVLSIDRLSTKPPNASYASHASNTIQDWAFVGAHLGKGFVNYQAHPFTLVLLSSPTCVYCRQSTNFHSKLRGLSKAENVGFYVAVPDKSQATTYLSEIGISSTSAITWKDVGVQVEGTPTLLGVDSKGIITRVWIGRSNSADQQQIISAIQRPSERPSSTTVSVDGKTANYSLEKLLTLRATRALDIIDVADHGARSSIYADINIPVSELLIRSPYELIASQLHVVDCSNLNVGACRGAVRILQQQHFQVATFGLGSSSESCAISRVP